MRVWADIAWKYRVNGTYFWNVDYWPYSNSALTTAPYSVYNVPTYEPRWGNGVLLYPGRRLQEIGLPAIKGPVYSIRLKAFRRGVQDYEYCYLAQSLGKNPDPIINAVITDGLGATTTPGSLGNWSHDPNDWYQMRRNLAALILGTSSIDDGLWQKY